MKNLIKNWKTTSAGLTMIIGSIVHLAFAIKDAKADEMTWTVSLTAIVGGFGLIFSGDASTTDKAVKNLDERVSNVEGNSDPNAFTKPPQN